MSSRAACTLQIPITDSDVPVARHTLPHQMRTLGRFADDVLISVNRPTPASNPGPLDSLIRDVASAHPNVRTTVVNYDSTSVEWVSQTFFGGREFPLFDFKGIPIHAFLEQYRAAEHPHFFQLAADMMLGGSGEHWLHEAIEHLDSDSLAITVSPLGGPPSEHSYHSGGFPVHKSSGGAFHVPSFSSRDYLIDLDEFLPAMSDLELLPPPGTKASIEARLVGNSPVDHFERLFGRRMADLGKFRLDMAGSGGLWTLHPPHKTTDFLSGLPHLLDRVEAGDIPEGQRGKYDLHESFLPLSDVPNRRQIALKTLGRFKTRVTRDIRSRVP